MTTWYERLRKLAWIMRYARLTYDHQRDISITESFKIAKEKYKKHGHMDAETVWKLING